MPIIDAAKSTRALRARLQREQDPILRRNIELVVKHMECELREDLAGIMSTVAPEPVYRFYGARLGSGEIAPPTEIRGFDAVRAMYAAQIELGGLVAQESNDENIVVDTHCVAIECFAKGGVPGKALIASGHKNVRPELMYLYEGRVSCFMSISDDGFILGEVVYSDPYQGSEGIEKRPLRPEDVVLLR